MSHKLESLSLKTLATSSVFVPSVFRVSPLVRAALWTLYLALMLPMPFLVQLNPSLDFPLGWIALGLLVGGILLEMALSEQVHLSEEGLSVRYPWWVPSQFRRGWSLRWPEVTDLKARSTGQGGLVYYLVSQERDGFLLPMRVVGFHRMLGLIQIKTGINTQDVKPLAQPWMYATLLGVSLLLLIADGWILSTAWNNLGGI
ncbi:MAG: hypothetical protein MH252_18600 [Thermosynechococcaceae cyanobacterium MS004]|nr:hypothetical protein [Thermosynechococcaceae cyanobacterium MS004]